MNCSTCGSPIPVGATYCPSCGALSTGSNASSGLTPDDMTVASSPDNTPPPPPSTSYGDSPYGAGAASPYSVPPSPYGPYNLAPPPSSPPPQRRGNRTWLLIVVPLLVIILILGGVLAFVLRSKTTGGSPQAGSTPALSPAQITATAQAHLTAAANTNLTATVQANLTATASVIAANQNPYATGGTLVMHDPLSDNSQGFGWAQGSAADGSCTFTGGVYQVNSAKTQAFHYCTADNGTYSNFTLEAQVQITRGDCGGLIFRADPNTGKLYLFEICTDGSYNLYLYRNSSGDSSLLANASTSAIKSGLNKSNTLAVTAQGSTLVLYVNMQKITSVSNNAFSQGQIALVADSFNNTTDAVFSNARLWTL